MGISLGLLLQFFVATDTNGDCVSETWNSKAQCLSCYELALVTADENLGNFFELYEDCSTRR